MKCTSEKNISLAIDGYKIFFPPTSLTLECQPMAGLKLNCKPVVGLNTKNRQLISGRGIVNISIVLLDMKRKHLMNQETPLFFLRKQLILIPSFRGSIWSGARGSHCSGERGQFTLVLGGQFDWIFHFWAMKALPQ